MAKTNKEEYHILKCLDDKWQWIARDGDIRLYCYKTKPHKAQTSVGGIWEGGSWVDIDSETFRFIQWEDEEPYRIQELIDEYESEYHIENAKIINIDSSKLTPWTPYPLDFESEETEVNSIENVVEFIESNINFIEEKLPKMDREKSEGRKDWLEGYLNALKEVNNKLGQLDETELKNISLQDVTHRLWGLALNDRKYWLEKLNNEFQEGYIVPLGLKTTDGEEQYLTLNGSYFACRRNEHLQQTFSTLEEIPEFYRDLAERML